MNHYTNDFEFGIKIFPLIVRQNNGVFVRDRYRQCHPGQVQITNVTVSDSDVQSEYTPLITLHVG